MRLIYRYVFVLIVIMLDNCGCIESEPVSEEYEYVIGGVRYSVAALYDESGGITLIERFKRLLLSCAADLTTGLADGTISTESVSAVGKDKDGKDS